MSRDAKRFESLRLRLRLIRLAFRPSLDGLPVELMLDTLADPDSESGPDRLLDQLHRRGHTF